jgi:hypothetical protein
MFLDVERYSKRVVGDSQQIAVFRALDCDQRGASKQLDSCVRDSAEPSAAFQV